MFYLDETKTLSIAVLKRLKYLNPGGVIIGTIYWHRGEQRCGSIAVTSFMHPGNEHINLQYTYQDTTGICYDVVLKAQPSHLGVGQHYMFVCPVKGVLCRKLYLYQGRFVSRRAIPNAGYSCQQEAKSTRMLHKLFGPPGWLYEDDKNRKYHYRDRLTPWGRKQEKITSRMDVAQRAFVLKDWRPEWEPTRHNNCG